MSKVRVALVRPPIEVLKKFSKHVENLGLAYLATALRRSGHEVVMLDGMLHGWSTTETVNQILNSRPDIVGFTIVLQYFPASVTTLVTDLREAGYGGIILVGGHSASFFPERIVRQIPPIDAVVCGEGELSICAVADAVGVGVEWRSAPGLCWKDDNGYVQRTPTRRIFDLDEIGDPARDLTGEIISKDGLVALSSSRGCYARCSFCSIPRFYGLSSGREMASGDWIGRSAARTIEEIASLHDRFMLHELLIVDDEFFGGTASGFSRALAIGRGLEELHIPVSFAISCRAENVDEMVLEQLQRGGLRHVFVGIESGSNKALKLYGKRQSSNQNRAAVHTIKKMGLSFQPGFMMFNYRSTVEQLRQNLDFLIDIGECKPLTINTCVDPHFGSPLVNDMANKNVLYDHGFLEISSGYEDPHVAAIKRVADLCVESFEPYMEFIARVRSAVTYEWRRCVPHRALSEEHVLDAFEGVANRAFANVVVQAVDYALAHPSCSPDQLVADARCSLDSSRAHVQVAHALVTEHILEKEGSIHYVSQKNLISQRESSPMRRDGK